MAEMTTVSQKDRAEQSTTEQTRGGVHFVPRVDIYETDNELLLLADLPGVKPEDVDLHYEKGELTLHARVKVRQPEQRFVRREYEEGDFYRAFNIHESIDASKIEAQCKNGVLTVQLPKLERAKPKQIAVRGE